MADTLTARCDVTELITDQCAHCRRLPDPKTRVLGKPFAAMYAGRCADCDEHFEPGDRIRRNPEDGSYVGPCCGEEASDG